MKVVDVVTVFGLDGSPLGVKITCANVSIVFEGMAEDDPRIEDAKDIAKYFHSNESDFRMIIRKDEFNYATILRRQNYIQASISGAAYARGSRDSACHGAASYWR